MSNTKHLDLHVPRGWAYCTTRELEMIAEEMIRAQMMASLSRFHPFDWTEIKTRLFFRFSGVEIVSTVEDNQERSFRPPLTPPRSALPLATDEGRKNSGGETDTSVAEQVFICRLSKDNVQSSIFRSPKGRLLPTGRKNFQFELTTWQVHSFMEQLAWLDATDAKGRALPMPKLMWPYPTRLRRWWPLWKREYYAPGELMDGMTWQTYRWINDWMEAYTNTANALVAEREKKGSIAALAKQERDIRQTVLSLIFGCPKWRVRLARITEVEWQVIMFWWSSMMQYLKEQYPKCFKSSDKKPRSRSKQQPLPIELYTRSMATLQKYLGGLTEAEINAQTAHAILRHLNDMAVEAEEMEKIRKKHK